MPNAFFRALCQKQTVSAAALLGFNELGGLETGRLIVDRDQAVKLKDEGLSLRQISRRMGIGLCTIVRTLQERSKSSTRPLGT